MELGPINAWDRVKKKAHEGIGSVPLDKQVTCLILCFLIWKSRMMTTRQDCSKDWDTIYLTPLALLTRYSINNSYNYYKCCKPFVFQILLIAVGENLVPLPLWRGCYWKSFSFSKNLLNQFFLKRLYWDKLSPAEETMTFITKGN